MTYHFSEPDGRKVKSDLNRFLTRLRKRHPCGYLWILEFQRRGAPHLHLYTTLPHDTPGLHEFMAKAWNRIAEPESPEHLEVHLHESNFIPWDMGSGSYLCKYLDKAHQKAVPQGFSGVGRFWGASRGIVPPPDVVGEVPLSTVRILCRHHEKSVRSYKWKSHARRSRFSARLPNGAGIARRLIEGSA